ncbi:MAG: putative glycoside hydrolase [Bacillota bacterium]
MSRAAKIYILLISLTLIFLLGTGSNHNSAGKNKAANHYKWLASLGALFDFRLKETAATPLEEGTNSGENGITVVTVPPVEPAEPPVIKGVYLTGWMAGNPAAVNQLLDFVRKTEVNSVVIDVKDDSGLISYPSKVPMAEMTGSARKKFNPEKIIALLKENNIYPIARIVVFKDPYLAMRRPDLAVKSSEGGLWSDFKGLHWVDPYNKQVWDYNIAIAKEAVEYGFKEIQFDYIRFTSDGITKNCRYPSNDGRVKSDVIRDYLKYAYQELKPLGVKVSADVFGLTCSAQGDIGIGQVIEKVAEGVDIICPMVYPSHYYKGVYNIPNPDAEPYETVYKSLTDALQKLANLNKKVALRPWLQDFSLKSHYGKEQLLAQIKAVESAGLKEWIFWNPVNKYDYHKYRPKSEVPEELFSPTENEVPDSKGLFPNSQLDQPPAEP